MSRYRTIDLRIHADEKFCELSRPQPNGQTLFMYLFIGDHTGPLPGLYRAGELALAEALHWDLEPFRAAWSEIADRKMAYADWARRVVWLPNRIRYDEPANVNVVKSWRAAWDEIPECDLKSQAWDVWHAYMVRRDQVAAERARDKGEDPPRYSFAETFETWCPRPGVAGTGHGIWNGYRNGPGNGSTNGSANGMANQDQDQEQDQDLLPPTPLGEGGGAPASTRPPTRAERKRAEERRSRVYGRCPHQPQCETFEQCIVVLVRDERQARSEVQARGSPALAAVG